MSLSTLKRPLLQFKFEVRSILAREPALAPIHRPVIWWTQHKNRGIIDVNECYVGEHTELVIDGFQGSGNSFATVAFKRSQVESVQLAHHLHSPAQLIRATKMAIPILLTIREPRGAAISLTSRWPYVSLTQAVRGYSHFYEKIEPYVESMVVSSFNVTTKHLDIAIQELNRRFGKEYGVFEYTEDNMNALRSTEKLTSERELKRNELKAEKRDAFDKEVDKSTIDRAIRIYERLEKKSTTLQVS